METNTKNSNDSLQNKIISKTDINKNSNTDINKNINKDLYKTLVLEEIIFIKPIDLNKKIDDIILSKLKQNVEGKCLKYGYVMPNSIEIKKRSSGIINNASFDGNTTYKINYTAELCNPCINQNIQCKVENIDKSQLICYIDKPELSPIEIYLFKHNHSGNVEFLSLKQNDIINVKVGISNYKYKDKQIICIGEYLSKA